MTRTQVGILGFLLVMNILILAGGSALAGLLIPTMGWETPLLVGIPLGVGVGLCDGVVLLALFRRN